MNSKHLQRHQRATLTTYIHGYIHIHIYIYVYIYAHINIQPVSKRMRLDMVVEMEFEILEGHHRPLFKRFI